MDPLSEVFALLDLRTARCTRLEASGSWSYRFPAKPALKFGVVIKGDCWMDFGNGTRHSLVSGTAFLLANAPPYILSNSDAALPEDGIAAFDWANCDVARHEGDDTVLVAGSFNFEPSDADLVLNALPRILIISPDHAAATAIRSTLSILDGETRNRQIEFQRFER